MLCLAALSLKKGANTVEVLNLNLGHGDMVVMDGADIQKCSCKSSLDL
jgi:hypothetical protein